MTELAWALAGISGLLNFIFLVKIFLLRKGIREITAAFSDRLTSDTNTLIDISTRDRTVRRLAVSINEQLRLLRKQRHRYLSGDRELKEAVTNISHDLRTPLTAICGYLDLMEREEHSPETARYLSLIAERAGTMKQLTEELFRYSVILSTDELTTEPVNINAILEESIAAFYTALTERKITPAIDLPETAVFRNLNKAALSRIFGNILNNALKYSDGDLEIRMDESGTIFFTNTAASLDEVQVGRLFERFFTVKTGRNSTGLGLSIAKTLVEQMGGRITARYQETKLTVSIIF